MLGAEDSARSNILPVAEYAAISHRQATIVVRTHGAHLAMNAHLLALEACALSRSETVIFESVSYASLLVEFALHNRILWLFLRGSLSKCQGRRCSECRHEYKLEEFHGVSPSVTAVAET
jgi:hypothetical protein